ncbi:Immunity protein Imm1 [Amycolatopsis arida]|uniref:Immunity protein Imm1 n=1 Tax=Amycolatopsis arida TaxID=587909 RepID=A0A1I5WSJ0_9PSEU|nr:Imm1 family immunity protein [Amycolatopsis arida]TDX92432.1 immunity protein Imm1 of predicted polymorphic toxin system [Amycolatopsis arida]SFQ22752.1 Immunity protein Imm1 [Amycolatopsis arida]
MTHTATYRAAVPTFRDGVAGGEDVPVSTEEDVDRLVTLLVEPGVYTASLQAGEGMAVLEAHVQDGYGYLRYYGLDQSAVSAGVSASPPVESEVEFPGGSGLPLDQFRAVLAEFVKTGGRRPAAVEWRRLS